MSRTVVIEKDGYLYVESDVLKNEVYEQCKDCPTPCSAIHLGCPNPQQILHIVENDFP